MKRILIISWVVMCFSTVTMNAATERAGLKAISYEPKADYTRLVFIFHGSANAKVIDSGDTLIVKFDNTVIDSSLRYSLLKFNTGLVNRLSLSQTNNDTLTVTLLLDRQVEHTAFFLDASRRYVLDLFIWDSLSTTEKHYRKGLQYQAEREYQNALSEFRAAIHGNPMHGEAYFHAGVIRLQLGGSNELAFKNLKKAVQFGVGFPDAHLYLSSLYALRGNPQSSKAEDSLFSKGLIAIEPFRS